MERFLAELFLIVLGMLLILGNFWFSFGIWPINWWAFVLFTFLQVLLVGVRMSLIKKEKS